VLVELVDYRYKLRQQTAPNIDLVNPTWLQFITALIENLPQLNTQSYFPFYPLIASQAADVPAWIYPDMSQLNRPGTPVTKLFDCIPRRADYAYGTDWTFDYFAHKHLVPAKETIATKEPKSDSVTVEKANLLEHYEAVNYRYLFPRFVNGKHRPELKPYEITVAGSASTDNEWFTITSSNSAKFADENDACPYNLADLHVLSAVDRPRVVRQLGRASQFRRNFRFWYGHLDFALFDFICPHGPVSIEKFLTADQHRRHSYAVMEQFPKACEEVRRVRLLENMPTCSDAMAYILTDSGLVPENVDCSGSASAGIVSSSGIQDKCPCNHERVVLVRDTAGIARSKISRSLSDGIANSVKYAPANSMGFARPLRCGNTNGDDVYELISIGQGCDCESESSGPEDCCEQWYTRFENLGTVTSKAVGSIIASGEVIGTLKPVVDASLTYMAWLANSTAGVPGAYCTIDLTKLHKFQTRNTRPTGQTPCSSSYSECSVDYAKSKMASRVPLDASACTWYEDLSVAQNGSMYYARTIKADPATCAKSRNVFNFTSSYRTRIQTKGADYVVLVHECAPSSASESSGGPDPCCAVLTDHDVRCIGGTLQKWKKETEVCWDGECLVTRVFADWSYTGENAGCCDCSGDPSSGSTEPCVDNCRVKVSACFNSFAWNCIENSYDSSTGNWTIKAIANIDGVYCSGRVASQCGADAKIVKMSPPPLGPWPKGTVLTIHGTSTPPTDANCNCWRFDLLTYATVFWGGNFIAERCGGTGGGGGGSPGGLLKLNANLIVGGTSYGFNLLQLSDCGDAGITYSGESLSSTIPACLSDDATICGSGATIKFVVWIRCDCPPYLSTDPYLYNGEIYYVLFDSAGSQCSAGLMAAFSSETPSSSTCPPSFAVTGTGASQDVQGLPWNSDCSWSLAVDPIQIGLDGVVLDSTGASSDKTLTSSITLGSLAAASTGFSAASVGSASFTLNVVRVTSGNNNGFAVVSAGPCTVSSSASNFI
jgi:hypothetical protein